MDFAEAEFEDDELLAYADMPLENHEPNFDLGLDFEDDLEVIGEENPSNVSVGADDPQIINNENAASNQESQGFDFTTGKLWIYPTNYPVRDYQYNIVQQALFKNTLVVLPTGLGKTFIAAVVMYNFYRWFPQGKVVFMAPTKPLVAQQMQACYNIMGIPKADSIEMTGTIHPAVRQRQWKDKRVIFLTPQVMTNDLSRGSCEAKSFKCLVVDEAHKALGNQSYCQVIRELCKVTNKFRVLALSATPGSTLKAVQTVMDNLLVSHIELRTEDSIDIKPYTHERKVEKVIVPLGEELTSVKEEYVQIMTFVTQRLTRNRALYNRPATSLSKFLLLKARDEFRQNPPQNIQLVQRGNVEADFCMAISLYHGYDLLQLHGLRSLYNFLMGIVSGEKGYGRTRVELLRNADFNSVMNRLHHKFAADGSTSGSKQNEDGKVIVGHPKMQVLEKIVVEHFQSYKDKSTATKVVIFSQFRDSVQEIASILNQHQPLVKVMPFIGQSSSGKDIKGFTQKEQLEVMQQFREAGCNTLVSTCVGEEGLDIGDVDLIICFDAHKSPIRLVQRMGRTGRKREGKIVMLVTEGKEEQIYNQSVSSKRSIHKAILNGAKSLRFYPNNPRMVPASIQPQCHKMHITVPEENKRKEASKRISMGGKQKRTLVDALKNQGTSRGATTIDHLMQSEFEEIRDEFAMISSTAKVLPKPKCLALSKGHEMSSSAMQGNIAASHQINLSEWTPWQNRLQRTFQVGHSLQSKHLVKDSEFIEIQRVIGEEEDNYAIEMKQYVNQSFVSQSSITSFLKTPAKAQQSDNKGDDENVSISPEGRAGGNNAGPSCSKNTVCYVVDSSDSDTRAAYEHQDGPGMEKGRKTSTLFTELRHVEGEKGVSSNRDLAKGKKDLLSSQANKRKSKKSSKSAFLKESPLSSSQSRIRLLKKSKKTLQKRKSSLFKLLESKLNAVTVSRGTDDFENASQHSVETHMLDNEVNGETVSTREDTNGKFPHIEEINRDIGMCSITSESHVSSLSYENSGKTEAKKQVKLFQYSHGKEREGVNDIKSSHVQIVPPAPCLEELDRLMSGLCSVRDFAEIDLEHLVQDWCGLSDKNTCKSFSEKCEEFAKESGRDIPKGVSLAEGVQTFKSSDPVPVGSHIFPSGTKSKVADENHASNKDKVIHPVSPTFIHSRLKHEHRNESVVSQNNADVAKTALADCDYGKVENPVIISPVKPEQTNLPPAEFNLPCRDSQNSQGGEFIHFSPEETHKDFQQSQPYLTDQRDGIQQSQPFLTNQEKDISFENIPFSPKTERSAKQDTSTLSSRAMSSNAILDKDSRGTLLKTNIKSCEKKQNISESFITFTQAHECLLSSSSEYSHELPCNQSGSNSNDRGITSPDHNVHALAPERNKQPQDAVTPKHSQSKLHKFLFSASRNLSPASNQLQKQNTKTLSPSWESHGIDEKKSCTENEVPRSGSDPQTPLKVQKFDAADDSLLADFDLGFDLDEEVIPPTPDKVSPHAPVVIQCVKRPLFSDKTKSPKSPVLPSPQMKHANNATRFNNEAQGSEQNNIYDAEDIQADFDLCAELDDLDEWPEDPPDAQQFHEPLTDLKNPRIASAQDVITTDIEKALSVCDNDIEVSSATSNASQKAEHVFQNYKGNEKTREDFPAACGLQIAKTTSTADMALSKDCKSKPSKLKLGKRKKQLSSNDCNANASGDPAMSSNKEPPKIELHNQSSVSPKHIPSKIRFNLRVPDFSESDDENAFLDKIKPSKVTSGDFGFHSISKDKSLPAEGPSGDGNSSTCRKSSATSLTSPVQNISACQTKVSPSRISCSTPLRASLNTGRDTSFCKDDMHLLTPIQISPEKELGEKGPANSVEGKWLKKKKHPSTTHKKCGFSGNIEQFPDLIEDDLDDFEEDVTYHRSPDVAAHRVGSKRKRKRPGFIEEEAEVSGDEGSSDEDDVDGEDYEMSFIDNHSETQGADMQAMYLQSVKNPVPGGRYKLQFNARKFRHEDVFSQAPEDSHGLSEFEEDSFCVGSDEEESEMESPPKKVKRRKSKSKTLKQVTGKRVIRMLDSSSEEDDVPPIPMTQEFQTNCNRKTALLSSDEEMAGVTCIQRKKVGRIVDDTQSIMNDCAVTDHQSYEASQNAVQGANGAQNQSKSKFTLLKENCAEDNPKHIPAEATDKDFQEGDFNLLDDDWMHELDLPLEKISSFNRKVTVEVGSELPTKKKSHSGAGLIEAHNKGGNSCAQKVSPVFDKNRSQGGLHRAQSSSSNPSLHLKSNYLEEPQADAIRSGSPSGFNISATSNSPNNVALSSKAGIVSLSREERLQRQREKQEKFRKKLAQAQQRRGDAYGDANGRKKSSRSEALYSCLGTSATSSVPAVEVTIVEQIDTGASPEMKALNPDALATPLAGSKRSSYTFGKSPVEKTSEACMRTPLSKTSGTGAKGVSPNSDSAQKISLENVELQVLVDSREISGAQDVISNLRIAHGIVVTARRLPFCDYIVSNHTAVDRLSWSNFSNSTNRSKLSSRLNEMQALYDRCVLIVEDDRVKPGQDKSKKQVNHTKYVDTTMTYLMQTKVKVYFTCNYDETALVIAELCQAEARKGRNLSVPASLNDRKEDMLNFVLSIHGVTMPQALNLVHRYRNIAELVSSPAALIQERGQMVQSAAQSIYKFFRHCFDNQMMPEAKV